MNRFAAVKTVRLLFSWVLVSVAVSLVGCASDSRDKWLRFFFDGVPPRRPPSPSVNRLAAEQATGRTLPGSAGAARPRIFAHRPYTQRKCASCHVSKSSQKLAGEVAEVCGACHADLLAKAKNLHSPAEEGECLTCHEPHKAKLRGLLKKDGKALCYECHDDDVADAKHKHSPVVDGKCISCHDPHRSNEEHLLAKAPAPLCFSCHGDVLKGTFAEMRQEHAVKLAKAIAANNQAQVMRALRKFGPKALSMSAAGGATPLHVAARLDRADLATLLISAGADVSAKTSGGFTPLHWAASGNAADTARLLIAAGADPVAKAPGNLTPTDWAASKKANEVLQILAKATAMPPTRKSVPGVFSRIIPLVEAKYKHSPVEEGECLECHDAHKSKHSGLVKKTGAALCYECHDDEVKDAKVKHSPAEEGECLECHDPHKSESAGLLKKPGRALCLECHDADDLGDVKAHEGQQQKSCIECHDPHKSDRKSLLKK